MNDKKSDTKISENPSIKDMKVLLRVFNTLGRSAKLIGNLGFKQEKMLDFSNQIDELNEQSKIIDLPDRFNKAFVSYGWIAVGSALSVNVMEEALTLHAKGNIVEAETTLAEWFTAENIELFAILRARRFHQANLRDNQLKEALQLYLEERYMAAVPLILIACDGFASDVAPVSPFEKNADLSCFDSITGHSTSLPELMKLITTSVRKSRDDELDLPLRHGILHGRSLGYANKKVCAKAWLLMMALVDWAVDKSSEDERRAHHEERRQETLSGALAKYKQTQSNRKAIDAFKPYDVELPLVYPLDPSSPENAASEFLAGWKTKNFGKMAKYAINLTKKPIKKMAGEMRTTSEDIELIDYKILSIHRSSVARCDVRIWAKAKSLAKGINGEFNLIVFRFTSEGNVAMPSENGDWCIQQNFMYNIMNEKLAEAGSNNNF